MKKIAQILKKIGITLLALVVILFCILVIYNEDLPEGKQSEMADELAHKMLKAVHHEAYSNSTLIEWTFAGRHHYKWYKQQQVVDVEWSNYLVRLNTQHPDSSIVFENKIELVSDQKEALIQKALALFNNDSFWLVAPHKAFDPGTERKLVTLENGDQGLLITYTTGGNTPGDSYLWILDETGLPKAFKLWVSILPIGGVEASWDSWIKTESGALLPTNHQLFFINISMGNVKAS